MLRGSWGTSEHVFDKNGEPLSSEGLSSSVVLRSLSLSSSSPENESSSSPDSLKNKSSYAPTESETSDEDLSHYKKANSSQEKKEGGGKERKHPLNTSKENVKFAGGFSVIPDTLQITNKRTKDRSSSLTSIMKVKTAKEEQEKLKKSKSASDNDTLKITIKRGENGSLSLRSIKEGETAKKQQKNLKKGDSHSDTLKIIIKRDKDRPLTFCNIMQAVAKEEKKKLKERESGAGSDPVKPVESSARRKTIEYDEEYAPPPNLWEASHSEQGFDKFMEYLREGRLARKMAYLNLSSYSQPSESSRSLVLSESGFIGLYINHVVSGKQNFFYNDEYSSKETLNAYREILKENSFVFRRKFSDRQFIPGSESDIDSISMSRISIDTTQRKGKITGIAKYRRIEKEGVTQRPVFQNNEKHYEILNWRPIKKVWQSHYVLLGCMIDFSDNDDSLPLLPQTLLVQPLPGSPLQNKILSIQAKIDSLQAEINNNNKSCWASFFPSSWYEEKRIKRVKKQFLHELKLRYDDPEKRNNIDIVNELAAEFIQKGQLHDVMGGVWRHETKDLMISLGYDAKVALMKSKKLPDSIEPSNLKII